ncbi:MAG: sulfite oxidase-like oxidoreductase [Acidobacteria bacterium]|nr:sulfite oxidase-like oxidoreductase [Acidobacteriota bacterium]
MFGGDTERKQLQEQMRKENRLPPGQSLTLQWPVLHTGSVPHFDAALWDFRVAGLVANPLRLSYAEFIALPPAEITADFHCVTRWSRLDNRWKGISVQTLLDRAQPLPQARFVLVHGDHGYTANVPLADLLEGDVLLATHHDGQPLAPEHGFPLRLIVPKLYAWKSVKWVRGLQLLESDQPGFWEQNGYHLYGDPWKEQRFSDDP